MSESTTNTERRDETLTPAEPQIAPIDAQAALVAPASSPETPLTIGGQEPGRILSFEEGLEFSLKYYDEALRLLAQ